jgi:hypothetical protein
LAAAGIVHFEEKEQEGGRNRRRSSSGGCSRSGTFFTDGKKEQVEHSVR